MILLVGASNTHSLPGIFSTPQSSPGRWLAALQRAGWILINFNLFLPQYKCGDGEDVCGTNGEGRGPCDDVLWACQPFKCGLRPCIAVSF